MLSEGQTFPDFSLPDQTGEVVTSASLRGSKVVLFFYPKDDTPGCTTEACGFRDAMPSFGDARVVGVSPDDARSHRKFSEKFSLPYTLLADEGHYLADACGVWGEKSMYGKKYEGVFRTTFVLDENGTVLKVFKDVKPQGHAEEVRAALG